MPLDAVALRAQVNELQDLAGYKIDKIQQPERDMIVLVLRSAGGARRLLISANSANPRINLTDSRFENPQSPPMFSMLRTELTVRSTCLMLSIIFISSFRKIRLLLRPIISQSRCLGVRSPSSV